MGTPIVAATEAMTKTPHSTRLAKPVRRSRCSAVVLLVVGTVMLLFGGTITDYARGLLAPDGIYIPNSTHRFAGEDDKRVVLSHTFRIYNLRPRRLSVQAEPDCGCSGVSWHNAVIAPFGWKDLTAKMEVKKSRQLQQGQSVGIALRTDSQQKPFLFAFLVR